MDEKAWNDIQDTVLSVAFRCTPRHWSWIGRTVLVRGDDEYLGYAHLDAKAGVGTFQPHDPAALNALQQLRGKKVTVSAFDSFDANWTLSLARVRRADPVLQDRIGVRFKIVEAGDPLDPGARSVYRIIYCGLRLRAFTHSVWLQRGRDAYRGSYSVLDAFDRRFIVSELRNDQSDSKRCILAVTFSGAWLSKLEMDALELVLFYLCGSGGPRLVVEMYDANGLLISNQRQRISHARARLERVLLPLERYGNPEMWRNLSAVVERAAALIRRGFPLRAILYQMFSGLQSAPELRLVHLSIALEAIKTATIVKIRGEGRAVSDQDEFLRRIGPAIEALELEFSRPEDSEALGLIRRRFLGANDWSERERWRRFWRDVVGYEVVGEERDVLEHRDVVVHVGYILDTEYDLLIDNDPKADRRPYEDRLRELDRESRQFQNIVDRVLLRLLGFGGQFLDATDNHTALDIGTAPVNALFGTANINSPAD